MCGGGVKGNTHFLVIDFHLFSPPVFVLEVFRIDCPAQFLADNLTLIVTEAAEATFPKSLFSNPGSSF